ncbi:hypothetical protein OV203_09170 [Nannocystis sp. ILAH1]|uniref:hypothetical protein n=1 Tax=unclassified Nannocystis TaxID=2627009 RepID=UPI002270550D|nr:MULTISPECIES: hypothetical protein [unclassified Nannocystis]MCY0987292.1 hypothetical protein [Nannocystis sp. ILAH1]MCY1070912.1 hypothetical protein [Nannocystis sp. RBIL2]
MNRKSFTAILLGGALAGGCSKPNPLFLDTWDVITDSGSVSQTSAVTLETTTIEPPTTTSDPPVTTTSSSTSPSTITSSSDHTTTSTTGPNPTTETTGEGFVCDGLDDDMDGCCEVEVIVEADTFLSDALNFVVPGCPVAPGPMDLDCQFLSFGAAKSGHLLKDDGSVDAAVLGVSMMLLRFPTKDGQLVSTEGPIVTETIKAIRLEVLAKYDDILYGEQMKFDLHTLDAGLEWVEGGGDAATECVDGLPSFACRQCGATYDADCTAWWGGEPGKSIPEVLQPLGVVDAVAINSGLEPIDLAPLGTPKDWVPAIVGGSLVVVPRSAVYKGTKYDELFPAPGIEFHTLDGGAPPKLVARVCEP